MKLFCLLITVIAVCSHASSNCQHNLARMKKNEGKGQLYSFHELLDFASVCINEKISTETFDMARKMDVNQARSLLDTSSFHCASYSAALSANATATNLPECIIPHVLPGTTVLISDCSSDCVGDQYLRLFDYETNVQLLSNDDGKNLILSKINSNNHEI